MNETRNFKILPLGDAALLVLFGNEIEDAIHQKVLRVFRQVKALQLPYIKDVVPAYSSLAIYYDLAILYALERVTAAFSHMTLIITAIINDDKEDSAVEQSYQIIKIPVCYAPSMGLDINFIATEKGLSVEEAIQIHTSNIYTVYMIGFLPGFPYMGKVDSRLLMPRKTNPRQCIEAGSVGIAGEQTGIYPLSSPGGWQIIGRTPLHLFRKESEDIALLSPGDQVQFYSISEHEFDHF